VPMSALRCCTRTRRDINARAWRVTKFLVRPPSLYNAIGGLVNSAGPVNWSERVLTLLDRWWRNLLTCLQPYGPSMLATLRLLLQPARILNNLSVLPASCPATPAPLSRTPGLALARSSCLTTHRCWLELYLAPCFSQRRIGLDQYFPLSSCVISAGILFAHFNCCMRSPSQHPKFSSFPGARLIGIGCNFSSHTLGPTVGPVVHEEKVGGRRGCMCIDTPQA
jgi:hypothetical protein